MNPYDVLGVAKDATKEAIKKAFRNKSKAAHPDVNKGEDKGFSELTVAYRLLSDDEARAHFDATGETDQPIDNLQSEAMGVIASLMDVALASEDVKYHDLPTEMANQVRAEVESLKSNKAGGIAQRARIQDVKGRFGGKSDFIIAMLDHKIKNIDNQLRLMDKRLEVCDRAIAILTDVTFKYEEYPSRGNATMREIMEAMARQADFDNKTFRGQFYTGGSST